MAAREILAVPEALRRPHRIVTVTRERVSGVKPDQTGRLPIPARVGVAYVLVSRDSSTERC